MPDLVASTKLYGELETPAPSPPPLGNGAPVFLQ